MHLRFLAASLLMGAIITVVPEAGADTQRSCDGMPVQHHIHRARALIQGAYALERWGDETPAKRSEIRAFQDHKACIRDAELRQELIELRADLARDFKEYRAYRLITPYDGPNGTHWAIPFSIVACESYGGSWSASNGSHVGPYQLSWAWNPPWPVTSFADQLAHHRIAHMLWTNYGASQWACA
jgi:hypothetical protein